jgi:NAD(P)-dependent dehydrogenase (short-subunit alcohol dehydrogenase family)
MALFALTASAPAFGAKCAMTPQEAAWTGRSLGAWDYVRINRLKLPARPTPRIILFNDKCRFETKPGGKVRWQASPHAGAIALPGGAEVQAGIVSGTMSDDKTGEVFFVMALPSVWEAAKIFKPGDRDGLTGVFLHEFSHVTQAPVLKPYWDDAKARHPEPQNLDDDRIQRIYDKDPAYVVVAERERDLLYEAANEPDEARARSLAQNALALREARQKRWFVGADAVWTPYDEIFLTMEGFGQWVAYAWLSDPKGGGLTPAEAQSKMRGGRRWWSQETGFSLFLVIDRFVPDWPAQAFATHPALGIDLLRQAVSARSAVLDIFFANAGIAGGLASIFEQIAEDWAEILRVNLIGPFLAIKHAAPHHRPARRRLDHLHRLVAGLRSGAGGPAYSASKAGVISLVQTAAQQLSGSNVRVNAICPGLIETGMTEFVYERRAQRGRRSASATSTR